jgi:excisionase family DNA binding protein
VSDSPITEWWTVREAARHAGVDGDTIRRWADAGKVVAMRTAGGHRRIDAASLHQLLHHGAVAERQIAPEAAVAQLCSDAIGWYGWGPPETWTVEQSDQFIRALDDVTAALGNLRSATHKHLDRIGG